MKQLLQGIIGAIKPHEAAMHPKFIVFNNRKYRLHKNGYYLKEEWSKPGETTLHRAIWALHNGPIPAGFHVHHKDGDKFNNQCENLQLVHASTHLSQHAAESEWVGSEANKLQILAAGELAKKWHASEAGKKWHSDNGKRAWEGRAWETVKCQCADCKNTFKTPYPTRAKFCSGACKERTRLIRNGIEVAPRRGPYKGEKYAK